MISVLMPALLWIYDGNMKRNVSKKPITCFAVTNYRDIRRIFGIKEKNRRAHMYLIGKTGTGKSTLILNMAISDIRDGNGLCLIDPHGDLAQELLEHIPKERHEDVVYFNPADLDRPIAFNPLDRVPADKRHLAASGFISVLKNLWPDFWGPRLEHILRYALLTLLEVPGSTLLDLPPLLTDKDYRRVILNGVRDTRVRNFWFQEFEQSSAWFRSEAVSPILNKVGQFLASAPIRGIIGQKESSLDISKAMDEGKIIIANLSKGMIGEDASTLLGSLLVSKIHLAALERAGIAEENRKSFYLYADEFHNFITFSFNDILAEARKYGLGLVLAHQYLEQLDEKVRAAVFGNIGTLISFRVGAEDAKLLSREFYPIFRESDLNNLPNYHIYLKLMIDGVTSQPFSAVTLPQPPLGSSHKAAIIDYSRKKYGRPREEAKRVFIFRNPAEKDLPERQKNLFS